MSEGGKVRVSKREGVEEREKEGEGRSSKVEVKKRKRGRREVKGKKELRVRG